MIQSYPLTKNGSCTPLLFLPNITTQTQWKKIYCKEIESVFLYFYERHSSACRTCNSNWNNNQRVKVYIYKKGEKKERRVHFCCVLSWRDPLKLIEKIRERAMHNLDGGWDPYFLAVQFQHHVLSFIFCVFCSLFTENLLLLIFHYVLVSRADLQISFSPHLQICSLLHLFSLLNI